MKDLESQLQSLKHKQPRRPLSPNFTAKVLDRIETNQVNKGNLLMKILHKPLFTALGVIAIVATSSTAYAAVANWPAVTSFFSGEHHLESGARIVEVKTEGCHFNDGSQQGAEGTRTYEIRKDSPLTNEQVVAMVQGICEESRGYEILNNMVRELQKTAKGAINSASFMKVEQVGSNSVTVSPDPNLVAPAEQAANHKTYRIADHAPAVDGSVPITFSDIKVGDTVMLVLEDARNVSTEKQGYVEDLSQITVKGIVKVPALTGSPRLFNENLGKEFVRVMPRVDGQGYDRVYEFHQ